MTEITKSQYLQRPRRSEEHLHLLHRQTVRATAPLPAALHQDPLKEQRLSFYFDFKSSFV